MHNVCIVVCILVSNQITEITIRNNWIYTQHNTFLLFMANWELYRKSGRIELI